MAPSTPVRLVDEHGNPITASNPLPTSSDGGGGGGGGATEAKQDVAIGHLSDIETAVVAVAGAVDGDEIQVDIVASLPVGDNNIGNVDVASIAAGETHIGNVGSSDTVITLTFSATASQVAANQVVADTQELESVARANGRVVVLKSITLLDKADQKAALTFVFLDANQSLGTENEDPSISDTNAEAVLGCVSIAAGDYIDLGGCSVATKECALALKAGAAATSIWVAILNGSGTPTYGASDLIAKFGFLRS